MSTIVFAARVALARIYKKLHFVFSPFGFGESQGPQQPQHIRGFAHWHAQLVAGAERGC